MAAELPCRNVASQYIDIRLRAHFSSLFVDAIDNEWPGGTISISDKNSNQVASERLLHFAAFLLEHKPTDYKLG